MIVRPDGTSHFHALRSKQRGKAAILFAFDPIDLTAPICATCC